MTTTDWENYIRDAKTGRTDGERPWPDCYSNNPEDYHYTEKATTAEEFRRYYIDNYPYLSDLARDAVQGRYNGGLAQGAFKLPIFDDQATTTSSDEQPLTTDGKDNKVDTKPNYKYFFRYMTNYDFQVQQEQGVLPRLRNYQPPVSLHSAPGMALDYLAYMVKTRRYDPGATLTLCIYKVYNDQLQRDIDSGRATKFNRHYSSFAINYPDGKTLTTTEQSDIGYVTMDTNYHVLHYLDKLGKGYMKNYVTDFETCYNITTRPNKAALSEITSYHGLRYYHVVEQHHVDWLAQLDEYYTDYDTDTGKKRRTTTKHYNYYGVHTNNGNVEITNNVKNITQTGDATTSDDDDAKDDE